LVVKNGSNARAATSGVIPTALDGTLRVSSPPVRGRVVTAGLPCA
jgi:hypothetical protein